MDEGEDITFQPEGPILLSLCLVCTGETMYGIDQQTARRPPETSPSSSSFNTSGEQRSDCEESSNILVNGTVSTKNGPYGLKCSQSASVCWFETLRFSSCFTRLLQSIKLCRVLKTDAALCSRHQVCLSNTITC